MGGAGPQPGAACDVNLPPSAQGKELDPDSVQIATWQNNKKAVLLLYFDDSTRGQATFGVPIMIEHGLVGTWFVNPGSDNFKMYENVWLQDAIAGGQELANHTMNHQGAANDAEADYEIGEAARIIWAARGEQPNDTLIAFNRGGGTGWDNVDLEGILTKYHQIDRVHPGVPVNMIGQTVHQQWTADQMLENVDDALAQQTVMMLSFHGIAANKGEKDYGNGAVWVEEFRDFAERVEQMKDDFWSAGYIDFFKYLEERRHSTAKLLEYDGSIYAIELTTTLEEKYYNEPLTLNVQMPSGFEGFHVCRSGKELDYEIINDQVVINAEPIASEPIYLHKPKPTEQLQGNYYVAPNGQDSNDGSEGQPFRTIGHGVKVLQPGQRLVVKAGQYDEHVDVEVQGSAQARIEIVGEGGNSTQCYGFRVFKDAQFVTISGFDIESPGSEDTGVMVYGNKGVEISNNHIHDCANGGISVLKDAPDIVIQHNTIEHSGHFGILLDGHGGLIAHNSIRAISQHHPKAGTSGESGYDADGIVIFGQHHTIAHNQILDIASIAAENVNPHSDAIQSSSNATNTVLQDSVIVGNTIRMPHPSGKGVIIEDNKGHGCKNVIISNNIVEFRDVGVMLSTGSYSNVVVANNVFKSRLSQNAWGTAASLINVTDHQFVNNIMIDCKNEFRKIDGGTGVVDYNLAYRSDGGGFSMTPPKQAHEIVGVDPGFVDYTGVHGKNDYHLTSSSPAIDAGIFLSGSHLEVDILGVTRPQGAGFDIGPYEYAD